MRCKLVYLPVVALLLCCSQQIVAQRAVPFNNSIPKLKTIREDLRNRTEKGLVPSISVGILRKGKPLWKESFGYADVERRISATPDTVYSVGSLSKSITGTALFKLVQTGKIDVEQPVTKYLKSRPIDFHGKNPTAYKIFHFLNMTAGIPHYWRYCYLNDGDVKKCSTELLEQASFSAFAPGQTHLYSNLSFGIVSQLVSDVSGKPFADYVHSSILRPAKMSRTFVSRADMPPANVLVAKPYKANGERADEFQFEPAGGGGFFSTVNDLLRFGSMHLNQKDERNAVLTNRTLSENHRVRPELPHQYYANGWGVLPLSNKGKTLLSNGAIEGAASTLLVLPEADVVIVVLVNKTVGNEYTDEIAFEIADSLLPDYKKNLGELVERIGPLFSERAFLGDEKLNGVWRGSLLINDQPNQLELSINDAKAAMTFNEKKIELANFITEGGQFRARIKIEMPQFQGSVQTADITFMNSGDRIDGILSFDVRRQRPNFLMPYYFQLERSR
jgi:CubicO group peptidase (beta-lactamase class C family)